jgi:hypothetical protein
MDNNAVHATEGASNETEQKGSYQNEANQSQGKNEGRHFGFADLWRIRRSAKTYRIHDRIPRL